MNHSRTFLGACLAVVASLPAQRTIIVDDDGIADFRTVQEAVDAADPGDIVRVRHGRYFGANLTKGIRLLAEPPGDRLTDFVQMGRSLRITGIPRDQTLVVAGFSPPTITLADSQGSIYLSHLSGPISIQNCEDVSLLSCLSQSGAFALQVSDSNVLDVDGLYVGVFGPSINVQRSNLTMVETTLRGGGFLPASFITDSHVTYTRGAQIFPGSANSPSYQLDGNNTVWEALHALRIRESADEGRLQLEFDTKHVSPHLMVGFSLANRPTRIDEGIFYLHDPSIRIVHASVRSPNEPRSQSVMLPPEFSFEHRWLGIPITFQAATTDVNGKITLSAPYTIVF